MNRKTHSCTQTDLDLNAALMTSKVHDFEQLTRPLNLFSYFENKDHQKRVYIL